MTVTEPVTLLTDYLLAALTGSFSVLLWRMAGRSRQESQRLWAAAFAASALAAMLGGSWHGFNSHLSPVAAEWMWRTTTGTIGLAGLLLLLGALRATLGKPWRNRLACIAIGKFLLYLVVVNRYDSYTVVIADYAPNLLTVLGLSLLRLKSAPFARWSAAGVLVAFAAAAAQLSGVSLPRYFNHNDLYHTIQAVSFWLLYRAGLLLRERDASSTAERDTA
jgi:Family of unknown function (DUF6962)